MRREPEMKHRSRDLRRESTPAEQILWRRLRHRQAGGLKFRRQHVIGRFIVDFYCREARLAVELDGESHIGKECRDARRQAWLEGEGLKVMRFWDTDVYERLDAVLAAVYQECMARLGDAPSP